jgi:hypothetical protein
MFITDSSLGQPVGLSGTHGQYEEDSSPTRGDLYLNGDNSKLQMSQFLDLYNLQIDAEEPNYSMDIVLEHNKNRYYQSLNNNPYFWYGPIGGTIIRNAAYAFMGRLMANYSIEHPADGILSQPIPVIDACRFQFTNCLTGKDTLKLFFAVSGEEGSFVYNKGAERIPENWYRRPTPYGVANFAVDLAGWASKFPDLLKYASPPRSIRNTANVFQCRWKYRKSKFVRRNRHQQHHRRSLQREEPSRGEQCCVSWT